MPVSGIHFRQKSIKSFCHLEQQFRASEESDAMSRLQESISGTAWKYLKLKQ